MTTPTHVLALTVSDLDYAGVCGLFLLDRRTGHQRSEDVVAPLARGVTLPGSWGGGPTTFSGRGLEIRIDEVAAGTRLRGDANGFGFEVIAERPAGHECLGVVVPWSDRLFQYTVKDPARPATGRLWVAGQEQALPVGALWATLDHGRGRWPHAISWNWGAGSGRVDGHVVGLQVGGRWTDGTGSTENAVVVDGRVTKIGTELSWSHDRSDWLAPWRVTGDQVDLTFTPEHLRVARTNLGVVANDTHQCFGTWSGVAIGQPVDGVVGWAEDVANPLVTRVGPESCGLFFQRVRRTRGPIARHTVGPAHRRSSPGRGYSPPDLTRSSESVAVRPVGHGFRCGFNFGQTIPTSVRTPLASAHLIITVAGQDMQLRATPGLVRGEPCRRATRT